MKQKFHIQKNHQKNELVIQEYAVIQSDLRKRVNSMIQEEDFALLCEQTYDIRNLKSSISEGRMVFISELRTQNFFPIGLYIEKIADKIAEMLAVNGDQSTVLIFDDLDYFSINQEKAEIIEPADEAKLDDDEEIDELLEEDDKLSEESASV